jgi:hypothetical protein
LWGANEKKLSFGGVDREAIRSEPIKNRVKSRREDRKMGRRIGGRERDVELRVVSIQVI